MSIAHAYLAQWYFPLHTNHTSKYSKNEHKKSARGAKKSFHFDCVADQIDNTLTLVLFQTFVSMLLLFFSLFWFDSIMVCLAVVWSYGIM